MIEAPPLPNTSTSSPQDELDHHTPRIPQQQRKAFPLIDLIARELQEADGLDPTAALFEAIRILEEASASV
ncbi:hypothetical protein [Mucisphaera calidilacus]|uniref:Uncharacterized protein n=1 Tax=Mucisphaera calidilacus TaxID=2527982 RepID=A0A518BZZ3_9BACT|nr:hypothetical protein [Mucisphaera calidilacus]QDU72547.1 hypothetical protein Pan265_24170 [Mucisphaera calidilacus]